MCQQRLGTLFMPSVSSICAGCLLMASVVGCALAGGAMPTPSAKLGVDEEKTLQAAGVPLDNKALLDYLKRRTLLAEDHKRIAKLIGDLDDTKFTVRTKATKELKDLGRPALPFLKKA